MRMLAPLVAGALASVMPLSSAQTSAQAAEAPVDSSVYRIAGVVIDARSGAAVSRADVTLSAAGQSLPGAQLAAATTDEDGSFSLGGLKAGKYRLVASRRGYVTAAYQEHWGFFTAIVTGPGLDTTRLRFQLSPAAIVAGSVSDDAGDPVPGAQVTLFGQNHADGLGQIVRTRSEVTDDLGTFEFARLEPGNYFLAASGRPWYAFHPQPKPQVGSRGQQQEQQTHSLLDVAYAMTFYADTTDADTATPIPLNAGDHTQISIRLHAVPALNLRLRLPDPVVESNGSRSRGFNAPSLTQSVFGAIDSANVNGISTITIENQTYMEISGLAPGGYNLQFAGDGGQGRQELAHIQLSDGDQVLDAASLASGVDVSGKVTMAFGAKLPDHLNIFLRSPRRSLGEGSRAVADDGTFTFHGVAPGSYELIVTGAGRRLAVIQVVGSGSESAGSQIQIGSEPAFLMVTLADGSATVSGFVKQNGVGFPGAMVVLVPRNPETNNDLFRRDQSDSDGSFALRGVVPGRYTLIAIDDGWELDWAREEVLHKYLARGVRVDIGQNGSEIDLHDAVQAQLR